MTVPTGTLQTFQAIGNREALSDSITDITPMERPFMANISTGSANAVLEEWQTDALDAASATNANVEGDDSATNTATATTRLANNCMIGKKTVRVSGTQRAVLSAGRRDEYSYQTAKRGRELVRDIERSLCANVAATAGAAGTARQTAGISLWLYDNQVKLGTANTTIAVTSGAPSTAPTAGTAATFTEAHLKSGIQAAWDAGGEPGMVLLGSHNKQLASSFGGIATQYRDNPQTGPGVIIASADVYVSDFGEHKIVASRFTETEEVYGLDLDYWELRYLRPIQRENLSKTGDSDRAHMVAEYCLCSMAPDANFKVATTTTA